jgi:hypothetical protein
LPPLGHLAEFIGTAISLQDVVEHQLKIYIDLPGFAKHRGQDECLPEINNAVLQN